MSDDIEDRVKQAQEQNRQDNAPGSENIGLEGDGKSGALSQARDMIAEHNQLAADVNTQMFAQDDAMIDDAIRSGNEGVAGSVLNQPDQSEQIDNQPDPPTHEQQDEAAGGDADGGNTDQTAPEEPQQEQPAPEQPQPEAEQPTPAPEQPAPAEPQSEAAAPDNGGATAASYEVPTAQTAPAPDATASAEPSGLAGSSNVPGVSEHPYGPDDVFTNVPNPEGPSSGDGPAIAPPSMPDTVPSAPGGDSPSTPDVPGGPQPSQPQPDQPAPEPSTPEPAPQPSTPAPQPEPQPQPEPSAPSAQPEPESQQPQNVPAQGDNGKAAYLRRQADRIEQRADMADNAANRGDRNMMRQGVLHQMDKRTLVHDTGVAGRLQGGKKSALLSHNAQLAADIRDSARTQSKLSAQYSRVHKDAAVGYRQANKLRKAADQMESKKAQPQQQQQVEPKKDNKQVEPKKENKQLAPAPKVQGKSLAKVAPKPKAKPAPKPKPKAPAPSAGNQQKIAEVPKQSMPGVGTGPSIGNIGGAGGKPFRTNIASYIEAPKLPSVDPRQIAKAGVQMYDNATKFRDNMENALIKVSPIAGTLVKGQRELGDKLISMTPGGMLSNAMGGAVRNYANGADEHKTTSTALVEGQGKDAAPKGKAPKGMKQLAPSKDVPQLSSTPGLPSASADNFTLNDLGKSTLQRVMMTDEAYNGGDKQLQQQAFNDAMKSYGDILKNPSAGEAMFSQESKSEQMKIAQEAFQQAGLGTINKGAAPQIQNQPSSFRTNRRLDALQDRLGDAAAKERSANRDFESQDLKYC